MTEGFWEKVNKLKEKGLEIDEVRILETEVEYEPHILREAIVLEGN